MSTRSEKTAREIFRPEQGSSPVLRFLVILLAIVAGRELGAWIAILAMFAYSKSAFDDFLTALWLIRRDPNPGRGRACALYCLSRSVLKVVVVALSIAVIVYQPFWGSFGMGSHAADFEIQIALFTGIAISAVISFGG